MMLVMWYSEVRVSRSDVEALSYARFFSVAHSFQRYHWIRLLGQVSCLAIALGFKETYSVTWGSGEWI